MKRSAFILFAGLLVGLVCTHFVNAAKVDKRALAKAWGPAERLLKEAKDVAAQVDAVKALNGLLDKDTALELLKFYEPNDKVGDPPPKGKPPAKPDTRPKDSHKVATAILRAVASMTDPDEALQFKDQVNARDTWPLRVRMSMLDAVGGCAAESTNCLNLLIDLGKTCPDTDMRVLSIDHLKRFAKNDVVRETVFNLLGDRSWRVRDVAIDAAVECAGIERDRFLLALINRLYHEEGKLRKNLADALQKITGENLGTSCDNWCDWWTFKYKSDKGLPPHKADKGATSARRIFETETFSNRFIFLIDSSVSMTEKISPEERERLKKSFTRGPGENKDPDREPDGRRKLDWNKITCKLDLAREELIRSLEVMDPAKTVFTIIAFSDDCKFWKEELVPTDAKNRGEAENWLRGLKGKNLTNVYGALDEAYDFCEKLAGIDPKKSEKGGKVVTGPHPDEYIPDTIYIYTDGYATVGKYCGDKKESDKVGAEKYAPVYAEIMVNMVNEVVDRNRVCRMQINSVGVGRQDKRTLGNLARMNKGVYVALGQ
ncbi:MAG: hypothetical protein IT462_11205 [Planctomycetes bacterium]|nr:hypothetical protein [Planctomycetota bacterium]